MVDLVTQIMLISINISFDIKINYEFAQKSWSNIVLRQNLKNHLILFFHENHKILEQHFFVTL